MAASAVSAGVGHFADPIAASSALNGSRIAPWRDFRERAGARVASSGQSPGSSLSPASQCREIGQRGFDLLARPADRVLGDQRRRSLPEGAGRDLLRQRFDPAIGRAGRPSRPCCRRSASARARCRRPVRALADRAATPPAARSRSCRAGRSCPAPSGAAGPVFKDDALRGQLVADPVGGREVAVLLGFGALSDAAFDIALRRNRPGTSVRNSLPAGRAARRSP